MSKQQRITTREQIRRERQRNAARFERWRLREGQPDTPEALILYRLLGRKRYRSSSRGGQR